MNESFWQAKHRKSGHEYIMSRYVFKVALQEWEWIMEKAIRVLASVSAVVVQFKQGYCVVKYKMTTMFESVNTAEGILGTKVAMQILILEKLIQTSFSIK